MGEAKAEAKAEPPIVALCSEPRDVEAYRCGTAFQQGYDMLDLNGFDAFIFVLKLKWTAGLEIQWVRTKSTKVFGSMLSS